MVTKVRGSFNNFTGTASIDGERPENSTVRMTVEVDSVDTRNEMRDNHLRSNDFLDIANYPQITFTSTEIKHVGGNDFEVTGELTIKGSPRASCCPWSTKARLSTHSATTGSDSRARLSSTAPTSA